MAITPGYWRIGTFPTDRSEDWWAEMRDGSFVAVGWDQLGNLTTLIYDPETLERRAAQAYPEGDPSSWRRRTWVTSSYLHHLNFHYLLRQHPHTDTLAQKSTSLLSSALRSNS